MIRSFACALALASGLVSVAEAQDTRKVSGALSYLQRIALPPDARAAVQATGRFGVVLGETEIASDGRQVPLDFEFTVPPGLSGTVSALIRVSGAPRWIIRDVPFAAGEADVALGELQLDPVTPLAFATDLICGDVPVSVGILDNEITLRAEGRDIPMEQVKSASGARYRGTNEPETEFWSKGKSAKVTLNGAELPECREVLPPAERPYRARGNEPGWHVDFDRENAEIAADYGDLTREAPRPEAKAVPGAYEFDMPDAGARLRIEERLCRDTMTGMPHPDTARLTLDGRKLQGCGGDPADLLTGDAWRITALGDAELIEPERMSLNFFGQGRVAGSAGCNRLVGGFTLTGEGLKFGPMASTMMACPEPLMAQERRMLDALEQVAAFDMDGRGTLRLLGEDRDTVLIEAARP